MGNLYLNFLKSLDRFRVKEEKEMTEKLDRKRSERNDKTAKKMVVKKGSTKEVKGTVRKMGIDRKR